MKLNKGFTIIEMVIVIAIIGILASVLIPTYGNVVASANESAALQTARSTMTNWLSSSTTTAGVPTSGTDANGQQFYAAYFEYKNSDNGQIYQFRYTSGGVERTDTDPSKYVNFTMADAKMEGLAERGTPQYVAKVYLTNPTNDAAFDANTYAVSVYKQKVGPSTNYYIKRTATGAYSCGGADVFAATSGQQVVYVQVDGSYKAYTLDGQGNAAAGAAAGDLEWKETLNTTSGTTVAVTGVTLNKETLSLAVGASETLTATVAPENATNKNVTWTSSNESVATVDTNGEVTAVAAGTATITVTTADGSMTATCEVEVTATNP